MKRASSRCAPVCFCICVAVATIVVSHPSVFAQQQAPASLPSAAQAPASTEWFQDDKGRPRFSPPVRDLQRPETSVAKKIALSPDGCVLAVLEQGSKGFRASLWDVAKGAPSHALPATDEYTREAHLEFSRGGNLLFREDRCVAVYDSQGPKRLLAVSPSSDIAAVALSHDDKRLLVGLSDGSVELWDVPTGKRLHVLNEIEGREIQLLFFSPASPVWGLVAGNNAARYLHVYAVASCKRLMTGELPTGRAQVATFSPDGESIVMRDGDNICVMKLTRDLSSLLATQSIGGDFSGTPTIAFSKRRPDVALFAEATDFDAVSLLSLKKLPQPRRDGETDPVHHKTGALAVHSGLLFSIVDGVLRVYTPDWQQQLLRVECTAESEQDRGRAKDLCISDDGGIAATLWENSATVTLVDVASAFTSARSKAQELIMLHAGEASELLGKSRKELVAAVDRMQAETRVSQALAAPLPDQCEPMSGRTLAESAATLILQCEQGKSHGLVVASPVTGERISTIPLQDPEERNDRYDAAFAADDGSVVGTIADDRVTLWSAVSGRALHSFRAIRTDVGSTCGPLLGPGGAWVAAAAYGDIVTVRHGVTGSEKFILKREGSEANIKHMASTPDGTLLGVLYSDNTLIAWSMQSGTALWSAADVPNERGAPIFSRKGSLVAAIADSQVVGWNTVDGSRVFALPTDRRASGVAFASDDDTVYILAKDGLVTAYDVKSSEKLWARNVSGVAYAREVNLGVSPDGRFLILTSDTGVSLYLLDDLRDAAPKDVVVKAQHCLSIPGERNLMGFGGPDNSCLLVVQRRSGSEIARTLIHLEGLHAQNAIAKANRAPPGDVATDLNVAITASGGDAADYFWYGSKAIADKARAGDRFDKEDAEKEAAGHRKKLETQKLFFSMDYEWQEKAKATGDGIVISVKLPMTCDFEADAVVKARECRMQYWMLMDDGSIRLCRNEADILNNRARIYFPEDVENTELLIYIEAPREVLKAIARKTSVFEVIAHLRQIQTKPRKTQGFYRADAVQLWGDCSAVRRRGKAADPEGLPDYFATTLDAADGVIVKAALSKLEVVQTDSPERKVVFSWPPAEE